MKDPMITEPRNPWISPVNHPVQAMTILLNTSAVLEGLAFMWKTPIPKVNKNGEAPIRASIIPAGL